jgi:hypothetical protein
METDVKLVPEGADGIYLILGVEKIISIFSRERNAGIF